MGGAFGGLEAVGSLFNVSFGLMVMSLAIALGALYAINNIEHRMLRIQLQFSLLWSFTGFLLLLVLVLGQLLLMDGFAVDANGVISMEPYKYFVNLLDMPVVAGMLVTGAVLMLIGVAKTFLNLEYSRGIWWTGPGTVLAVMAIFMLAGYNNTAYYPSTADLQSSLTLSNSCSSEFTLRTMAIVSLIIPFVVGYIAYFWYKMDRRSLTTKELESTDKY